jgi:hypothetical protein
VAFVASDGVPPRPVTLVGLVREGTATFDADDAKRCIEAVRDGLITCNIPRISVCDGAFVGTIDLGEQCMGQLTCIRGRCEPNTGWVSSFAAFSGLICGAP